MTHPPFQVADGLAVSDPQVDQVGGLTVGEPDPKAESLLLLVGQGAPFPFALGGGGGGGAGGGWGVERRVVVYGDRMVAAASSWYAHPVYSYGLESSVR